MPANCPLPCMFHGVFFLDPRKSRYNPLTPLSNQTPAPPPPARVLALVPVADVVYCSGFSVFKIAAMFIFLQLLQRLLVVRFNVCLRLPLRYVMLLLLLLLELLLRVLLLLQLMQLSNGHPKQGAQEYSWNIIGIYLPESLYSYYIPTIFLGFLVWGSDGPQTRKKCVLAQALRAWPAWHEQHFGTCRGLKNAAGTTHGVNPSARMADADAEGIKTSVFVVRLIKSIHAGTIITSVFLACLIESIHAGTIITSVFLACLIKSIHAGTIITSVFLVRSIKSIHAGTIITSVFLVRSIKNIHAGNIITSVFLVRSIKSIHAGTRIISVFLVRFIKSSSERSLDSTPCCGIVLYRQARVRELGHGPKDCCNPDTDNAWLKL